MTRPLLLTLLLMIWPFTSFGSDWESEASETEIGVHVLSNFGEEQHLVSSTISKQTIRDALRSLDWVNGFHQVVVVTSRGVSMEVGGSLDPEHGLSAMYRSRADRVDAVILNPPETVEEMENILLSFIGKDDSWRQDYEFTFRHY